MSEGLPIEVTCRVVGVSVSDFYMWKHRKLKRPGFHRGSLVCVLAGSAEMV